LQSLSNQIHDFNVGMGPDVGTAPGGNNFGTRVFWTAIVPDNDVHVDLKAGTAEMHVHNLDALDYPEDFGNGSLGPNWQTAYVPASVSLDVVWNRPVTRRVTVSDLTDQFAGEFAENQATVIWSAQSAAGFRFKSRAGNSMTSTPGTPNIATTYFFAEVGHEQNGIFFPVGASAAPANSKADALVDQAFASLALPGPNPGLSATPTGPAEERMDVGMRDSASLSDSATTQSQLESDEMAGQPTPTVHAARDRVFELSSDIASVPESGHGRADTLFG
jgi:hypothetical protein